MLAKEPANGNALELVPLTVNDLVTRIRQASERLTEDNLSRVFLVLASRFDDLAHVVRSEVWRSELEFLSVGFGVTGTTIRGEMKDAQQDLKKKTVESLKAGLLTISEHLGKQDWVQVHYGIRDLYSVAHRAELSI